MDGVTKPVTKDLWYRGTKENLNSKKNNADFKLRGTLKRFDFNIGTNTPTVLVNDEIEIETDGEFAKANR